MELHGDLFTGELLWLMTAIFGISLVAAFWLAPWRRLQNSEQLHVFLGACVALIVLWHIHGAALDELTFHFLGVTTFTLMFGWSLAVIGTSLALLAVAINSGDIWLSFPANELIVGIIPATLTQASLLLARSYLPKNFFVYVLTNGFLTSGLAATIAGYTAAWLLVASGSVTYPDLSRTILPFFPLIFFPEAFINGWIITILVCYRPQWVSTFSDELYLVGK
jgi:uncharacterized membrane protein